MKSRNKGFLCMGMLLLLTLVIAGCGDKKESNIKVGNEVYSLGKEKDTKEEEAKKKQKTTQVKEIRLSTFIEDHDIMVKAKTGAKFLKDGDKLKVSLRFRGREKDYVARGMEVMEKFAEAVSEVGTIDKKPNFEGRSLTMILTPKNDK